MQTITITLSVPDGVTFAVNSSAIAAPTAGITAPVDTTPAGPTIEDLKRAFMNAVKASKDAAFSALGYKTCSEVPVAEYAAVIERCSGVAKG